jgi:hypothetical protein
MSYPRAALLVLILAMLPEHMAGICLDRAFVIDGMAYKHVPAR